MSNGVAGSRFQAVLFDIDGTLVDSMDKLVHGLGDGFQRASGQRPTDEYLRSLMGRSLREQMMLAAPNASELELEQFEQYTVERYEFHHHLEVPFHAALDTLALVKEVGAKTALVTSKNRMELTGFLNRFSHQQHVDLAVSASDVAYPKPAPDSALLACSRLGVAPENAVFIGDSLWDLQCARAAGIQFVAVSYGAAQRETLLKESPEWLFDTPEALLEWAKEEFLSCPVKN